MDVKQEAPDLGVFTNLSLHIDLWQVVLGWACVVVFVVSAIIALILLKNKTYHKQLVTLVIFEVAISCVLFFTDSISFGIDKQFEIYPVTVEKKECDSGPVEAFCKGDDTLLFGGGTCGYCGSVARMETNSPYVREEKIGWILRCDEGGKIGNEFDGGKVVIYCKKNQ